MSIRNRLDFGTPSSISRDLRSTASSSGLKSQANDASFSTVTSPVIESSDGVLSKIYGSLVEPESKRQTWSCHGCNTVFQRDATIYVAPTQATSPLGSSDANNRELLLRGTSQDHYCRLCYSDRFSMGACGTCQKAVLGSTKEDGKFVKASNGDIWHGKCWKCSDCGETDANKLSVGMMGKPTCEDCFDNPSPRRKSVDVATRGRRISPSNTAANFSGSATRSGMGATIAELSKKFGKPLPIASAEPLSSSPERTSPERKANSRSNSIKRPLTAQFSGQGFNLAAFQPSSPILTRSDSRSRSVSPCKRTNEADPICAKCKKGPFEGMMGTDNVIESTMISVPREKSYYHSHCFCCDICSLSLQDSSRSFVRLGERSYAHPQCAPPSTAIRNDAAPRATSPIARQSSSPNVKDHPTHQRETRPSMSCEAKIVTMPTSYLSSSPRDDDEMKSQATRRFKSSAGAAPPTRSSLSQQRPSSRSNLASLAVASDSIISSSISNGRAHVDKFSKLGGMNKCGGCDMTVSALESIPGPRGMRWHKKCLVCSSKSKGKLCGKALDSSARVDEEGQIRCRQCFDCEHSRHPLK